MSKDKYSTKFTQLQKNVAKFVGKNINDIDLAEIVFFLTQKDNGYTHSTLTVYKHSVIEAYNKKHLNEIDQQAIDILKNSNFENVAKPKSSPVKNTSSKKRKIVKRAEFEQLIAELKKQIKEKFYTNRDNSTEKLTLSMCYSMISTGVRPSEFTNSKIITIQKHLCLKVKNGKYIENIRANGEYRTIIIDEIDEEYQSAIKYCSNYFNEMGSQDFKSIYAKMCQKLKTAQIKIGVKSRFSFYTLRHQATSNLKRAKNLKYTEIAAVLGHICTNTVGKYGYTRSGWDDQYSPTKPRPVEMEVDTVKIGRTETDNVKNRIDSAIQSTSEQ